METMKRPHAILLSSPGIGHIIPFLQFGQRLVGDHGVKVTLLSITAEAAPVQSKLKQLLCNKNEDLLQVEVIQPDDIDSHLSPDCDMAAKVFVTMRESSPLVRSRILSMETRPTSLIVSTGLLPIPGCAPIRTADLFEAAVPTSPDFFKVAYTGAMLAAADGLLVNSWETLEPTTLRAFQDPNLLGSVVKGAVYPIGPLVREANMLELKGQTLHWLNEQPDGSVLFISFGSGGALSYNQIQELALGLEASKQKFLWVIRPPAEKTASEFYFNVDNKCDNDTVSWLPSGFLTRTKEHGLVISMWAPQMEVLSHPSIGGFLSHCGWNSVVESIVNGVPMITWPLYAEQLMNAAMVSGQLKIGVSPSKWPEEGIIGREEVKKMVHMIMDKKDGESSFRLKAKELKLNAARHWRRVGMVLLIKSCLSLCKC